MDQVSALFAAVDRGDVASAAGLLDGWPSAIHGQFHAATALHRAAARGDLAMLALLIERGAELEAPDGSGATALSWASDEDRDDAVDWLLAHDARASAVALAARGRVLELTQVLEDAPWMLDQRSVQGTPLHAAVRRGRHAAVELLLARGADPGERDDAGFSALDLARQSRNGSIIALIEQCLSRGGNSLGEGGDVIAAVSYRCGACAEEIVIEVDRTQGSEQRFVEDCPVCCRANVIEVKFGLGAAGAARAELE